MTESNPATGAMVTGHARRGVRDRLRDARIGVKLGLILIVPTLAVLVLAADRIGQHGQQAFDIDLIRSLSELGSAASAVTQEVQHERMTAAASLANATVQSDQYLPQIRRTDQAIAVYESLRGGLKNAPASVADRLRDIDQQLSNLEATRQQVLTRSDLTVSAVVLRYGAMAESLVAYRESLGQVAGDTQLGDMLRAAAALSRTKLQVAQAQAVAFAALQTKTLSDEQLTAFLSTLIGQQESLNAFMLAATPEERVFVSNTLTGDAVGLADAATSDVIRSAGRTALISADEASRSLGAVVDLVRWAEERIDRDVVTAATSERNAVIWQVIGEVAALLVVIALALAFALLLARAMVRSLNALRLGALAVANRDLPQTVARLSDRRTLGDLSPAEVAAQVADPIGLSTKDEIGDVARAFNIVHREAVRVAAEQAVLHTSVSVMFLNLARRSQSLVDQMIAQLDDMERTEADSQRLARLFRLDHLATRMRRNDENLLVLAGGDSSAARREDSLVSDVLRAAQAEIEHYARVEFGQVDIDAFVAARAVNDVVRLLAELLDNATRFSPPDTAVFVSTRQVADYVLIQIEDRGVGLSREQVMLVNTRLAAPPTMDITALRMMGLAVVGRLAHRFGIQIEVHGGVPGEGTTVYIKLPGPIIILRRGRESGSLTGGGQRPMLTPWPAGPGGQPGPGAPVGTPVGAGVGGGFGAGARQWVGTPPSAPNGWPTAGRPPAHVQPVPAPRAAADQLLAPDPPAAVPASAEDTAEMPIYREVEASWFRDNRSLSMITSAAADPGGWDVAAPQPAAPAAPPPSTRDRGWESPAPTVGWQTVADEGWRAARSAAEAPARTQTRNGLPKRVPQAQLVPGSAPSADRPATQRSPDDVRGLLSAYHRGVQRGRGVTDRPVTE